MSYALELQVDTRRRFAALPIEVQEDLLDLFDQLAETAAPQSMSVLRYDEHHLFSYRSDSALYLVVLGIDCDHASRRLTVFDLWYFGKS